MNENVQIKAGGDVYNNDYIIVSLWWDSFDVQIVVWRQPRKRKNGDPVMLQRTAMIVGTTTDRQVKYADLSKCLQTTIVYEALPKDELLRVRDEPTNNVAVVKPDLMQTSDPMQTVDLNRQQISYACDPTKKVTIPLSTFLLRHRWAKTAEEVPQPRSRKQTDNSDPHAPTMTSNNEMEPPNE